MFFRPDGPRPCTIAKTKNLGLGLTVFSYPIENHRVGFFRRLPEESMRLSLEYVQLRTGDPLQQYFRLRHMIAADRIHLADQYQGGRFHIAQPMRTFPVMTRNAEMHELRQLGVRRPGELVKLLDFI